MIFVQSSKKEKCKLNLYLSTIEKYTFKQIDKLLNKYSLN